MSIWRYDDDRFANPALGQDAVVSLYMTVHHTRDCPYCKEPLRVVVDERPTSDSLIAAHQRIATQGLADAFDDVPGRGLDTHGSWRPLWQQRLHDLGELFERQLRVCPVCGWWTHFEEKVSTAGPASEHEINTFGGVAALKVLDLRDIEAPLDEVRAFLAARYDQRFTMSAELFERTVASVFRTLGYEARAVGRSGDDGIDVILDGPEGATIGVQVKRYRDRIGVHQIRELTGALVINRLTKGIFVTTSDFESGAARTAALSAAEGKPIELYNADRFYDALKLGQLNQGEQFDAFVAELRQRPLRLIYTNRDRGTRRHDGY